MLQYLPRNKFYKYNKTINYIFLVSILRQIWGYSIEKSISERFDEI